ncbi:hypothetical protein THAOC_17007 [Thalassiosira oceanica]|uniref:Uncharacterized protein n=1 Tax=Thalassiosira oceanica TaxID=159749 RepID=K0SN56_THAOC|nr:hypothetical protein THAOC_17007 [Thalassiosira oceanica]|eukprot:EJK62381.1 hypothetical protein THAOC_17007 [Thalassiosira oceanica]
MIEVCLLRLCEHVGEPSNWAQTLSSALDEIGFDFYSGLGLCLGQRALGCATWGLVFGRRGRVNSSCGLGRARRGLPGPRRGSRASGEATGDFGGARGCSNRRPRGCEGASTARRASTPAPRLPSASGAQENSTVGSSGVVRVFPGMVHASNRSAQPSFAP